MTANQKRFLLIAAEILLAIATLMGTNVGIFFTFWYYILLFGILGSGVIGILLGFIVQDELVSWEKGKSKTTSIIFAVYICLHIVYAGALVILGRPGIASIVLLVGLTRCVLRKFAELALKAQQKSD